MMWLGRASVFFWLAGLAGLFATPFSVEVLRLDENALMPLQSAPVAGEWGATDVAPSPLSPVSHEGIREALRKRGFPYHASGSAHCELTSALLKAKSNPQYQSVVWFADAEAFPLMADFMQRLDRGAASWLARDNIFVYLNMSQACEPADVVNDWLGSYHLGSDWGRGGSGDMLDSLPTAAAIIGERATTSSNSGTWARGARMTSVGNIAAAFVVSLRSSEGGGGGEGGGEKDILVGVNGGIASGLLPNLDLLTTLKEIHQLVEGQRVGEGRLSLALDGMEECGHWPSPQPLACAPPESVQAYWKALLCLRKFYENHWEARPRQAAYRFRDYNVDALSLSLSRRLAEGAEGVEIATSGRRHRRMLQKRLLDLLELYSRALNNVEEKLHHSTSMYMLLSLGCRVSTPLVWLWPPLALQAAALLATLRWLQKGANGKVAKSAFAALTLSFACFHLFQDPLLAYKTGAVLTLLMFF
mmetsp:Transcript_5494/g.14203  ORF Transcript_5494/g.14203 Transcript_5494/m.14203 type:complete len:473 (-) Transcript_5494:629-2047(-)